MKRFLKSLGIVGGLFVALTWVVLPFAVPEPVRPAYAVIWIVGMIVMIAASITGWGEP